MKFIICCPGRPAVNGHKRREFLWTPERNLYIFQGKVLTLEEYEKVVDRVFDKNSDLRPRVRMIDEDAAVTPITTLSVAREITLEEALEVVQRLAPDRLRGKPGPKKAATPAPVMAVG